MKNRIEKAVLVFLLLSQISILGQKNITHQKLFWIGYYPMFVFNENWNLKNEIQERVFLKPFQQHQLLFRSDLERKIVEHWSGLVGFTFFLQSPNNPYAENKIMVPELRPNISMQNNQKYTFFSVSHRYKLEGRFFAIVEENRLTNDYAFSNLRMRYQLGIDLPLYKKEQSEKIILKVKDEMLFNIGSKIVKNTFDQNRIYLGLHTIVNSNVAVELGYLNWFQQQANGIDFYNRDIVRLSLFHKIDFKNSTNE